VIGIIAQIEMACHVKSRYHRITFEERVTPMTEHTAELLGTPNDRRVIFLVMDGLGDLPFGDRPQTPLEAARKPNIDALPHATTGLFDPVEPELRPGPTPRLSVRSASSPDRAAGYWGRFAGGYDVGHPIFAP
jgi:hypothetical protein